MLRTLLLTGMLQCWCAVYVFCDVFNNRLTRDKATLDYIDYLIVFHEAKLASYRRLRSSIHQRIHDPRWTPAEKANLKHPIDGLLLAQILRNEKDQFVNIHSQHEYEPDEEDKAASDHSYMDTQSSAIEIADLNSVAMSIILLQETYLLDTNHLVNGLIGTRGGTAQLDANDCFLLHTAAVNKTAYETAITWANKALELINEGKYCDTGPAKLMRGIAYCYWKLGQLENSINTYQSLRDFDETFENYQLQIVIKQYLQKMHNKLLPFQDVIIAKQRSISNEPSRSSRIERFAQLCRGAIAQHQYIDPQITCFYKRDHPFLRLAPVKVEMIHLNPDVVIFRGAISEAESKWLIDKSIYQMRPGKVYNLTSGHQSKNRTVNNAWFHKDANYKVTQNLEKRGSMMCGLDLKASARALEMINYDTGGFFTPHQDWFPAAEGKAMSAFATLLYYLTEPEWGGSTAFLYLNISVSPTKGDALFWFNSHKNSMRGEWSTLHAACPVVLGDKWVVQQLIWHLGNQWVRPSSTNRYDSHNSLMQKKN